MDPIRKQLISEYLEFEQAVRQFESSAETLVQSLWDLLNDKLDAQEELAGDLPNELEPEIWPTPAAVGAIAMTEPDLADWVIREMWGDATECVPPEAPSPQANRVIKNVLREVLQHDTEYQTDSSLQMKRPLTKRKRQEDQASSIGNPQAGYRFPQKKRRLVLVVHPSPASPSVNPTPEQLMQMLARPLPSRIVPRPQGARPTSTVSAAPQPVIFRPVDRECACTATRSFDNVQKP